MPGKTLVDRIWDQHRVTEVAPGVDLLQVDRHLFIDLHARGFEDLEERGLAVRRPRSTFSIPDHTVSSEPGRTGGHAEWSDSYLRLLRDGSRKWGIRHFDVNDRGQGIVHVVGPELGITQPGILLVCGDSHTSTHGALGALSWGIGASEVLHVLATQAIVQRRPRTMRITYVGELAPDAEPKDLILHTIGTLGAAGGTGFAVEYAGAPIRRMGIEGRMTICNLSIEMGAKVGIVAPDEITFDYLRGREYAPRAAQWDAAVAHWRTLRSDDDARFDREVTIDAGEVRPKITWGTSPQDVIAIGERIPAPHRESDPVRRRAMEAALAYMGLEADRPIAGTPIDRVFIGSCTNSRIADLRSAASVVRGRKVAPRVRAWVVPGSQIVKRDAEAEGLDRVFREAGFEWREPGCSMCVGANGEIAAPGERVVSTSNRNFVGRQGPGARTHLASPAVAAACAIAGHVTDVRGLGDEALGRSTHGRADR